MSENNKSSTLVYETELIDYGNDFGVIIPDEFLKLLGATSKLHLTVESGRIVLSKC